MANDRPFGWASSEVRTPRRARSCMTRSRPAYAKGWARSPLGLALFIAPSISELQYAGDQQVANPERNAHLPWGCANIGPNGEAGHACRQVPHADPERPVRQKAARGEHAEAEEYLPQPGQHPQALGRGVRQHSGQQNARHDRRHELLHSGVDHLRGQDRVNTARACDGFDADERERDGGSADPHCQEAGGLVLEIDGPRLLQRCDDDREQAGARKGDRAVPAKFDGAGHVPADRPDLRQSFAHVRHDFQALFGRAGERAHARDDRNHIDTVTVASVGHDRSCRNVVARSARPAKLQPAPGSGLLTMPPGHPLRQAFRGERSLDGRTRTRCDCAETADLWARLLHGIAQDMALEGARSAVPRRAGEQMDSERNANDLAIRNRPAALILVVDDDSDSLAALQLLLSALGFEVATARSAQEALTRIQRRLPDLIITDCEMPRMSGLEFCRLLRQRDQTRDIPIVLYTGREIVQHGPKTYDRFVAKPADADAILSTIRALLQDSPAHSS